MNEILLDFGNLEYEIWEMSLYIIVHIFLMSLVST